MKFSKRTKKLATTTAMFGVGAIISAANDYRNLAIDFAESTEKLYDRSSLLATYINDMNGSNMLSKLLNLPLEDIESLAKTPYLQHPYN